MKDLHGSCFHPAGLIKLTLMLALIFNTFSCATQWSSKMKPHIQAVELKHYTGTWYEIARFPHRFERDLVGVTATYTLLPNGRIRVENQGYKKSLDGEQRKAIGKAKPAGDPALGHLKVSFFWIFYADYYILALDQDNYQWALVGSSTPNFLWILGRQPQMDPAILDALIKKAADLGYDISKLEMVPQPAL
jgi:lipocalin